MEMRKAKGFEIAQTKQIVKKYDGWVVPSQTKSSKTYFVNQEFVCNCPDSELHNTTCKHAYAVRYYLDIEVETPEGKRIEKKPIAYSQIWSVYDKGQIQEKEKFMDMLADLIKEVPEPNYVFGRPRIGNKDMIFASALKVYTQFSLRRFMGDLKTAKEKGLIRSSSCFASVGHFIQSEELTPILSRLIQLSSLALKSVERDFAVDSSGFRTTRFNDYCKERHSTKQHHEWIKCHVITGVKTNIITAVEIGLENSADSPYFIPLVQATADVGFTISEVSADKAYNGVNNYKAVQDLGANAYIPFKSNATGKGDKTKGNNARAWRRMFHYFQLNQEEFAQHYHKRSNVETTFFMIKAKFNDVLKSKTKTAQINELLLKILCHNIVVVNNEIMGQGIDV